MASLSIKANDLSIISALNDAGVRFIVIGGVAVQYFGCREWHDVDDLDLLIDSDLETAKKLVGALNGLGASVHFSTETIARPANQLQIKRAPFYTDILTATSDQEFEVMFSNSVEETHQNVDIRIVSRSDLIAIKQATIDNLDKHKKDIECLKAV